MQMSEEEKQRIMAAMMRSGMSPGMGGDQQQFAPPPEAVMAEFQSVDYSPMKDTSRLMTGGKKNKPKPSAENPNADILATHGKKGNSVGGDGSKSPMPSNIPMINPSEAHMPMPDALRKRRWWE